MDYRNYRQSKQAAAGGFKPKAYDDLMTMLQGQMREANKQQTNFRAASLGAGGAAALGTYGLTGLVPKLKQSTGLRLLLAAMVGGLAGVYTAGGINDQLIKKSL
jgi:hypothetical protein